MIRFAKAACAMLVAFSVSACSTYTDQEQAAINEVVSALPHEVEGCTFLGNVDSSHGSFTINGARNILKLKTAQLGGNHLVEIDLAVRADYMIPPPHWDTPFIGQDEFYMTGRAYYCPQGKGVKLVTKQSITNHKDKQGFANKPYNDAENKPLSPDQQDNNAAPEHSLKLNDQVSLPNKPFKEQ